MTGSLFPDDLLPPAKPAALAKAKPAARPAASPPSPAPATAPAKKERDVWSVSRLNREVRMLLEQDFPPIWLEGELCNLSMASSGHWYFALKDRDAQVRCAMFRTRNQLVRFKPREGQKVMVRGRVSLYEGRGEFQLLCENMEDAGAGALARAFEELKAKLAAEGLFAAERKRPLPRMPRRIGVITSPTGAAIRDILHILERRFAAASVLLYPVRVQGPEAPAMLLAAVELAGKRAECDVLIITRGGGSPEDLLAFNDEALARAIARSPIPTISGVGHEIDFTIADFVADVRAPTPSGAAELVVPDARALLGQLVSFATRLTQAARRQHAHRSERFDALAHRLVLAHPGAKLAQQAQRLDELELRLTHAMRRRLATRVDGCAALERRFARVHPEALLAVHAAHVEELGIRALAAWSKRFAGFGHRLALATRALDSVSPLSTLGRGFALVTLADGTVVRDAAQLAAGDAIGGRLARGEFAAVITRTKR